MADDLWLPAVIGAGSAALTAAGSWVTGILKDRYTAGRVQRRDAINEWSEIVDKLQIRVDEQEKRIYSLLKDYSECEKRSAELAGEVKLLQMQMRRLQARADDSAPGTVQPVNVTVDTNGIILNVGPSIAPLLHWLPRELLHKSVELLVPQRILVQHRAAFSRTVTSGQAPDPERVVLTYALTKEGEEVPVAINVCGWQDSANNWFMNAEIRRRCGGDSVVLKKGTA